jgi:Ca-activated chloride channel family protein
MIHFAWPWMVLLLPLPWLHYRWRRAAEPTGAAVFMPFVATFGAAAASAQPLSRSRQLLFLLLWLLVVVAATRPQWLGEPLPVPTTGRKLLMAVDVSGSMGSQDMAGAATRLQVVQAIAGEFIERRQGDQVGLILFGTQPYLQAPLTQDLATVHRFLDDAVIGIAGTDTAIGDAIGLAIKRLSIGTGQKRTTAQDTVLILLTDGQNTAGAMPPLEAARLAKETGLRIYTIGVGAAPEEGFFGLSGNADLDEPTLQAIAKNTGGRYFRATDAGSLQGIYERIDALEPAAGRAQLLRPATEWFIWPLGLAFLLSAPAAWWGARAWT